MKLFYYAGAPRYGAFWFSVLCIGIHFKRTQPLFSERYGYIKPFARWGEWRVFLIRPYRRRK